MKNFRLIALTTTLLHTVMLLSTGSPEAGAANWQTAGGGNWNDTANWNTADVPDTVTENANFPLIASGGPHIVTLNDAMYPTGLTIADFSINTGSTNISAGRIYDVQASGDSGALDWTIGEIANPGSIYIRRNQLSLNNVNMDLLGTTGGTTIRLFQLANSYSAHEWNIDATNSSISVNAAPVGTTASGLLVETGSAMRMTGGDLTIANGTNNALITVTGTDSTNSDSPSTLELHGTTLTTNEMSVTGQGVFTFNGAGAASTSDISGSLSVSGGSSVSLNSGEIDLGTLDISTTGSGLTNNVSVNGATVNVAGAVLLKTSSNTSVGPIPSQPDQLFVTAGSLTAVSLEASGASGGKGAFEVNVSGTGSLDIAGTIQLGWDETANRHGAGTLIISGGSVTANALIVGADRGSDANSVGFYEQTGGVAEFGSIELSRDDASGSGYGTKEFVVGSNAELRITGAGFSQVGQGDWLVDDGPGTLDFSGEIVFDPSALTSQTLLAFGKELTGARPDTPEDIAFVIQDNYGIGTLDLSGLDGSEVLNILPSFNELNNALYVGALIGVTDINVTDHLDSAINIYYSASLSPLLNRQTFQLNSGGLLIPLIPVPEPSSLLLVSLGAWIGVMRRRKKQSIS